MNTLPKSYVAVARQITGYFGTYLPSERIGPGMILREVDGVFVKEGFLGTYPGYSHQVHGASKPTSTLNPVSVWRTKGVRMQNVGANADTSVAVTGGEIRLEFGAAKDAIIICNGTRSHRLNEVASVQALIRQLYSSGNWEADLCVVTDVLSVSAAWICFATGRDQVAHMKVAGSLPVPLEALPVLENAALHGGLSASWSDKKSAGFYAEVGEGGTPLFRAIRLKRKFLGLGQPDVRYLKSLSRDFEEPDLTSSPD